MGLRRFLLVVCPGITKVVSAATPVLGEPAAPVAGVALGTVIRTTDAEELRFHVVRELTSRYATRKGITVSRAEIDTCRRNLAAFMKAENARWAARLSVIERELQDASLPPERRSVLASEADVLRSWRASEQRNADSSAEVSAEDRALLDSIPAGFIKQWKINRAPYHDYGGRVIAQQGGPEPLDASRKFLEEAKMRGDFVIVDMTLDTGFWQYYRDEARHRFLPPGRATSRAIDTPPWAGR